MPGSENSKATKFFYVYVIESVNHGNQYIGYTKDLKERIKEHNKGLNKSSKPYLPWKLIYYEASINEQDAKRREKYFKTNQGRRLLKRRLKEYYYSKK